MKELPRMYYCCTERAVACMLSELWCMCCTMLKVQLCTLPGAPPHARMLFAAKKIPAICMLPAVLKSLWRACYCL